MDTRWTYMINWLKDRTHVLPVIPVKRTHTYKNLTIRSSNGCQNNQNLYNTTIHSTKDGICQIGALILLH